MCRINFGSSFFLTNAVFWGHLYQVLLLPTTGCFHMLGPAANSIVVVQDKLRFQLLSYSSVKVLF